MDWPHACPFPIISFGWKLDHTHVDNDSKKSKHFRFCNLLNSPPFQSRIGICVSSNRLQYRIHQEQFTKSTNAHVHVVWHLEFALWHSSFSIEIGLNSTCEPSAYLTSFHQMSFALYGWSSGWLEVDAMVATAAEAVSSLSSDIFSMDFVTRDWLLKGSSPSTAHFAPKRAAYHSAANWVQNQTVLLDLKPLVFGSVYK